MKLAIRLVLVAFIVLTIEAVWAQDADLAPTPPMGWNSWNHFGLNINDAVIREQAKALVTSGMRDAGYNYVVIDGGWEGYHDADGNFRPNILKFPDMKGLADYVHSLGLKVGIHDSPGPVTCAGREASYGHEEQDAKTFASWGIDFVKYDWCSGSLVYKPDQMRAAYEKFHQALLSTGRPIVYNLCQYGMEDVWKWGASVGGNMWRTTGDIRDSYDSMVKIGFEQNGLEKYAGPGHWNDPDMLEIGNGGLDGDESRTQMSLWAILAAPLFAGNDLTKMSPETLAILTNREVIAVDQDKAGIQGHRAWQEGPVEIWMKPLAGHSIAVGLFNRDEQKMTITLHFRDIGVNGSAELRDLWTHRDLGSFKDSYTTVVQRHGVVMLRVKPQ
ncbi:MAG: glycoside hydrolase family 27 protein [Terracidiphilus sp.]